MEITKMKHGRHRYKCWKIKRSPYLQATKKSIMETLPTRRQAYIGAATAKVLKTPFSVSFSSWRFSATTQRMRSTFRRRQVGSLGKSGSEASFTFFSLLIVMIVYSIINLFFLGEGHLWWVQEKPARSWTSDRREEQEPRNSLHYSQAIKDTSWYCNIIFSAIRQ